MKKRIFDFDVDKKTNSIIIKRTFDAALTAVWEAWTNPELLDQWWAPKPYRIKTKELELRKDGRWLYAMISPQDEHFWCKAEYQAVEILKLLSWLDAFCDEDGNDNQGKPNSCWMIRFTENDDITIVDITLKHEKLADVEKMIEFGFKEGFELAMTNLDELLKNN